MNHTSEKLAAVATAGFIFILVLDMIFNNDMFEKNPNFWKFGLFIILTGNLGVMVRHLKNKDDD